MNIYGQSLKMLEDYFRASGENPAKAKIVFKCLYRNKISSFFDITELAESVKARLSADFEFSGIELITKSESDSTCKYLFRLADGHTIETVLMKHEYGNGVCVSTQVGCNMDCAFCESGKLKKMRNLEVHEMVQQVLYLRNTLDIPVSHVVLMGIGEPFDNYDNVINFTDIISNQQGISIPARHITISTAGIVPKILEYADRKTTCNLAISLHAPNDELRNTLMPINKAYPVADVVDAARVFAEKSGKKVTFAYIMIAGVNDYDKCAIELAKLVSGINCYVNLIPYNKTRSASFEPSEKKRVLEFYDILKKKGINVTVRREFGGDMNAACGQLSSDYSNK